jgi:hypothetical protein
MNDKTIREGRSRKKKMTKKGKGQRKEENNDINK